MKNMLKHQMILGAEIENKFYVAVDVEGRTNSNRGKVQSDNLANAYAIGILMSKCTWKNVWKVLELLEDFMEDDNPNKKYIA